MPKNSQRQRNLTITDKLTLGINAIIRQKSGNDYVEVDITEFGVLDVVPGTGTASKAMVLDSSGDITMPGVITFAEPQEYDANTGITAFATGGAGSATALTGEYNNITTCATAGDSVKLPEAALGLFITVKNSGAASCAVFPATSDSINALAVNLSINVPVGGSVSFRAISAVVWETNEVISVSAPTTQTGEFGLKAVDNAADHEILLSNASMGQATVITIPDPGASTGEVILVEGASSVTGVKSFTVPVIYDHNTGITAFATGGQASAVALTGEFNNVTTCATAGDSVKLIAAIVGQTQTVKNSGAASLAVFPITDDAINALAANLSVNIPVGGEMTFRAIDAVTYETNEVLSSSAPTTLSGELAIKASDNAADHEIVITNASHAQASTHTIPDAGAAGFFVMSDAAQVHINEAVTTTNVITAAESGTHFILNATGTFVSTLPAAATGLEFWFHIGATEPTGTHTVVTDSSANIIVGNICTPEDAAGSVSTVTDADSINFILNLAVHGDYCHVWCDGTNWYLDGMCKVQDAITTTSA